MMLELVEGCELVVDGESWWVQRLEPYWGRVVLRSEREAEGGRVRQTTIAALMRHRDCRVSTRRSPLLQRRAGAASPAYGRTSHLPNSGWWS